MGTHHRVALFPRARGTNATSVGNALHTIQARAPSRADLGYQICYAFGFGISLGLLHHYPRHSNPATGSQVARRLVSLAKANKPARSHKFLVVSRVFVVLLCKLGQLSLELADLVLELDDIVAANLLALGRVEVFAYRAGALTG